MPHRGRTGTITEHILYPVGDKLLVALKPLPEETPAEEKESTPGEPVKRTLPKLATPKDGSLCCGKITSVGGGMPNHGPDKTLGVGDTILFVGKDAGTEGFALVAFNDILAKVK